MFVGMGYGAWRRREPLMYASQKEREVKRRSLRRSALRDYIEATSKPEEATK